MRLDFCRLALVAALLLVCAIQAPAQAAQKEQVGPPVFGGKQRIAFALQGDIYYLPEGTSRLPDFSKLKRVGTIYTTELNVPSRSFDSGFPGVTNRFEWFAIDYHGTLLLPTGGQYKFRLTSDDGSQLWIDGKKVIDVDGIHPPNSGEATVELAAGTHKIRVPYFQGPRFEVALQLEIARPGKPYQIFNTQAFAPAQVEVKGGKTKVSLGSAILFDFNQSMLKPGAAEVLAEVKASVLDQHPKARFVVEGYTDDVGSAAYNLALSQRRAQTVVSWLRAHGVPGSRLTAKGLGKSNPKVPNTSDENRAQNRRVEIAVEE